MKTMKLTNKFAATAFAALALAFATSCSEDTTEDPTKNPTEEPTGDTVELKTLTEDLTLDASKKYVVKSAVQVPAGKTLTIPAGTEITSEKGKFYIAVLKGGKINVNGTKDKPVVMKGKGGLGDWGGLVICGDANTTKGTDAKAEVDDLLYGGSNEADNSGSISYLVIKDAGFDIAADKQFNGLTLYAVGSGTKIDNVAAVNGKDDGIEFFGGSVSVTNFYAKDNGDDQIDWTQGWKGSLTNSLVEFSSGFEYSTVVEADGEGVTEFPTLENLKATASKAGEGTALQFKNDSNATFTKVSLTDFGAQFEMKGSVALADLSVNGAAASEAGTYDKADDSKLDFSWVK